MVQGTDGPVFVIGDEARLVQVITNLLTNAARYTESGGRIEVRLRGEAENAVIVVSDNGSGIPQDLLPRVFDLFSQGPRTSDRAHGGLGIGLSLVRSLVSMHGGEVRAESEGDGRGSTFTLTLPVARPSRLPAPPARSTALVRPSERRRVLIVDDNRDAAMLVAELLRDVGHEVSVAHDGPEALSLARERAPDVAILDLGLPVMDGFELADRLRDLPAPPRLIALTGYGQKGDRARTRAAGFDAHLVKPISSDVLLKALR